jgi:hypothetical protein
MILETKQALKNLKGDELKAGEETLYLGEALANIMLSDEAGGKMKLFVLAQKLFKENKLEVDSADLSLIKECVKRTKVYNALVAGQVEILLEDVKIGEK